MVRQSLASTFVGAFLVVCAHAELNLTPRLSEYTFDGATLHHLSFLDGDKEVTYQPPHKWEYSGSTAQLKLRPPNKSQAEATVVKVPWPAEEAAFDEPLLKKLTDLAVATLPSGSTNIQLLGQDKNPVMIDRKETFRVTMSYTLYGETYGRSVMFMNRGREQIRFQLTSRLDDFKDLQQAFQQSLFTWQNL